MNNGQKRPNNQNTDLVNERVRFPEVLLIGANGEQLGKMSSRDAYHIAVEQELDLLCVAPNANPPVCKLINYNKYRFEQQKKPEKTRKNNILSRSKKFNLLHKLVVTTLKPRSKLLAAS